MGRLATRSTVGNAHPPPAPQSPFRGAVLLTIRQAGVQLMEFKPNLVKRAMTAHGLASKGQMQRAVQSMFDLPEPPSPPDVADAIAIALCAARRHE